MKRIPRDPERFAILDLCNSIGERLGLKLNDETSEKRFLKSIETSLCHHKTPTNLHGRRVEAMFGYMVASLGRCSVIKQEDCGEVFLESTDAQIPDYRIVTQKGEQFLVEVKNCHKACFSSKLAYVARLKSYASMLNTDVKLAIYWSR